MINFNTFGKYGLLGLFSFGLLTACTDLETPLYSEISADNFLQTDEEIISALGAAYTSSYGFMGDAYAMQEVTSDEVVVPTRGNDWDDGGNWRRLHLHTYVPNDPFMNGTWTFCYSAIANCNRLLAQFDELGILVERPEFGNELRALRAFYYYLLLDMFGNVPLSTDFNDTTLPGTSDRQEVYDFVVSELEAAIPTLSEDAGSATYGRMNKWAALAVLSKVYLNAEVYTGTARWEEAADAAQQIVDSGNYSLANNFFDVFAADNTGNPEIIFAIPYDQVFATGHNTVARTLHYLSQNTYNLTFQPWNGYCSLEEFYNSFEDDDVRKGSFIVGDQFDLNTGEQLLDDGAEDQDPNGPPLTFTPEINELAPNALRQAGARIGKYEFEIGATQDLNNDVPLFRLGDIMLTLAEAKWRMNNGDQDALEMVNMIRDRAKVDAFDELNEDNLLAERGREVAFEAYRRQDLIRFGKYNDAWWEKPADASNDVNIFPIPFPQIDANPNIRQNPGY